MNDQTDSRQRKKVRIYVMTHKAFDVPEDPMYVPVHVGRKPWRRQQGMAEKTDLTEEARRLLTYTGDDSGENISDLNCYYSELTGLYWVWKNVSDADYVGTCHYRRYLLNQKGYMFTESEIAAILSKCDVITTKNLQLNYSYYDGFAANHKINYLDETGRVIAELYPEYSATFEKLVHQKHTYFGNMLICSKKRFDAYCEWLFDILFEVQRRVKVEEEDSYHRRIFGFISEFLQYVWIYRNHLNVYACMVGMMGEKAEVTEVKNGLAQYFAKGDYAGARDYFLEARRKRPDILMEASDITGELHLSMEVIAIAGLEQQTYGTNLLDRIHDFRELMTYCSRLNQYVTQQMRGDVEPELEEWMHKVNATKVAIRCALSVVGSISGEPRFPM